MQLLADKHGDLRPSLIKLESPTLGTVDDTMMETSSDDYTVTPPESFISESWTELNGGDVDGSLHCSSPRIEDLIERCVDVLERHTLNVMAWRDDKIGHLLAEANQVHDDSVDALMHSGGDVQTTHSHPNNGANPNASVNGSMGSNLNSPGYTHRSTTSTATNFDRLPTKAREELLHYISSIASMYKIVLYHNFEHASHVLASSDMLLAMLNHKNKKAHHAKLHRRCSTSTSSSVSDLTSDFSTLNGNDSSINGNSGGLNTNNNDLHTCPLTQLALVLSALVHDVEHQGVGNKQLVDESHPLAIKYKGKSVAENNSLNVALAMLGDPRYSNLYSCMFGPRDTESLALKEEIRRELDHDKRLFLRFFYDIILATDINSQERLQRNKEKWKMAFEDNDGDLEIDRSCRCTNPPPEKQTQHQHPKTMSTNGHVQQQIPPPPTSQDEDSDSDSSLCLECSLAKDECFTNVDYLRTSAILEQLIQAADVAHLMQSWQVFIKWNVKLYNELWAAKLAGRGPDVSANWFKGQIGFFDFYIIPLAKRLEHCGLFKSLGSLFVENATENRRRWILEGEQRCREMHTSIVQRLGDGN